MEWGRPAGRILLPVAARILWCSDRSVIRGNPPAVLGLKRVVVAGRMRCRGGAFIARLFVCVRNILYRGARPVGGERRLFSDSDEKLLD
jgi:hypothetical protein